MVPMRPFQVLILTEQLQMWMLMTQVLALGYLSHLHRVVSEWDKGWIFEINILSVSSM